MEFTGERYMPGVGDQIAYEHLHRYALACEYVSGRTVLDIASGEGYGSRLLAKSAKKVVGVDLSEEAISHAKAKYANQENLDFLVGSCTNIPAADGFFDVVVSFETIEHITEHDKMLDEIKRVLKPGGILIISSPNKKTYTDDVQSKNVYHVHELYLSEFKNLLNARFKNVFLMGQRLTFSSHIWPEEENTKTMGFEHYSGDDEKFSGSVPAPYEALYFIAICADAGGMSTHSSLFTQTNDSLFNFYSKLPGQLEEKAQQLAEKERQLAEKDRQLAEKNQRIEELLTSLSWKVTAPLRKLYGILKK